MSRNSTFLEGFCAQSAGEVLARGIQMEAPF